MENNEKLTSAFREKIDAAKRSASKKEDVSTIEAIGLVAGILFIAAIKIAVVGAVVWFGSNTVCDIFKQPHLTYLQIVSILLSIKAVTLYIFDKDKKENN